LLNRIIAGAVGECDSATVLPPLVAATTNLCASALERTKTFQRVRMKNPPCVAGAVFYVVS
jgi:hypothetical protein